MKEIIIDGVDVAGCEFYFEDNGVIAPDGTPERANICTSPENSCKNDDSCYCNKNCYYKQLKRAEIEIEKLKGVDGSVHPDSAYYKIARLEQENAELKAKIKNNETAYQVELGAYNMECGNLLEENKQLLQTLQEIKEIAEFHITDADSEDVQNDRKQIIDLITKAEGE